MPVAGDTEDNRAVFVQGTQSEYKHALVEVLAEVMHPPDFTQVTGRYAWCIHVNKLLRELRSVTTKLDPADLPPSFVDVDEFVTDAWRLAVTDEVPEFYEKWPRDLDRLVGESFQSGVPLGRMMAETTQSRSAAGSAAGPTSPHDAALRNGTTKSSTPHSTPSLDSRVYSAQSSSSSHFRNSETSPLLSPTRRFSMADFALLVTNKDKVNYNGTPRPQPLTPSTSSSPVALRASSSWAVAPTSESLTPERSASLRRSASVRPWIPQSYRDGSMPADLAELFSKLDEVCQAADTLIIEAEDIDANDEGEMRLREWTSRARKCEANGRQALARVASAGLTKTEEVLYVTSTLNLLKSAHIELIEYAESMLKSAGSAQREATSALQPAMRDSESIDSVDSVSPDTPVESGQNRPGPSRSSTQRRLSPYVLLPTVPWRWLPVEREPDPEPSKPTFLTSSIVIRTTRAGSGKSCTIKLQRMTDREPGDERHEPACSECAGRGFSCFGIPGVQKGCRRCRRVRKGHCTYARLRRVHAKEARAVSTDKGKGKGKEGEEEYGKRKVGVRSKEGAIGKGKGRGAKRPRTIPKPSMETLRKLRSAGAKKELQGDSDRESDRESESDDEDGSDTEAPLVKRRKSASPRATHEPEADPRHLFPVRATSEPPDRASCARSRSRRPRLASLARSSNSSSERSTPVRDNNAGFDSLFAVGLDRMSVAASDTQSQPELRRAPEPESEAEPEEVSTIALSVPVPVPAPALVPASAPALVPALMLTPTSLPSPALIPSPTHDLNPAPLLVAALTAKLDTLTASQAALTAEVRSSQAKLALQEGVIAEVREALRVLTAQMGLDLDLDDGKDDSMGLDVDSTLDD